MALKDKWVDKIDGQDYVNSNDVNTIAQELIQTQEDLAQNPPVGEKGEDGATFIPSVSSSGVISWTNNKGLPNPQSVNIKGADGKDGENGKDGVSVTEIKQTVSSSADEGINTFAVTLSNGTTANFSVKNGSKGSSGAAGPAGTDGKNGIGIASITQTTKSNADDGVNIITITLTNGATQTFEVQNGSKGSQGEQGLAGADGKSIFVAYEISGKTTGDSGVRFLLEKELYPEVKEGDIGIYVGEDEQYCEKGTVGIIEGISAVQPTYLAFKPIVNIVGQQGEPGKKAYEYAQEGGYVGTEEEFGKKLAEVGNSQWQATFETNIALPIISEQTVTISQKGVTFTWDDGINLVVGNTYTVIWNGVKHICTCYIDMEGYPALGDDNLWSATLGTYPFYISRQSNTTIWIYKETIGQETIVFSILDGVDGAVYNTLPMEYLPEDVVTIAQLEAAISGAIAESY